MKKTFLSIALAALTTMGMAQSESMEAFKHLGVGVEAGLMGAGVQVAMPVVTNHLVLVVGYNFMPEIKYGTDVTFDVSGLNSQIDLLNAEVSAYNLLKQKNYTKVSKVNNDEVSGTIDAALKMNNFKALLEYYPSANHSFHITAGVMIGNEDLITLSGVPDDAACEAYASALKLEDDMRADNYPLGTIDIRNSVVFNVDDKSYQLADNGHVDAAININKVKPYVGIGFGRAVPTKRVGFQFEIGAWMHGTPSLSGNEADTYHENAKCKIEGVGDLLSQVTFYPQMTFRLTGKIF